MPRPEFKSQQPHIITHIRIKGWFTLTEKREKYTKYEKARIIGARALQRAAGAPVLMRTEEIDPIEIAMEECESGNVPITVKRKK